MSFYVPCHRKQKMPVEDTDFPNNQGDFIEIAKNFLEFFKWKKLQPVKTDINLRYKCIIDY